jgi:hypothetical protein
MLVKFNPTLGTTNASLRAYNFMRVITAVATAAAGSTPVVRPMTAQNTFDNGVNLITGVIANAEAGGWSVSGTNDTNGHNLPDTTYTDANLQNRVYRADFWRASNKPSYPYVKFTVVPQVQSTWTTYPFMDVICGIHTDTRFNAVVGYAPSGGDGGGTANTGRNITAPRADGTGWGNMGIRPNETGTNGTSNVSNSEFLLAVTQDYFILIQPRFSMTYVGLRTTNLWENNYENNPPLVAFHTPLMLWTGGTLEAMPRKMMAWWLLKDGLGQVRQTPFLSFSSHIGNIGTGPNASSTFNHVLANRQITHYTSRHGWNNYPNSEADALTRISGDPTGGPLFRTKAFRNNYMTLGIWVPWSGGNSYNPIAVGPSGWNYPPIVDPNTGILVPPAYPLNMMLCVAHESDNSLTYFNQGGRLPGIYKSLSGSDEFMNRYYVPGQNFIVDSENYYPYVTGTDAQYRDMFLIRRY